MSTVANIAIQDGAATPVTHTFYPIQAGALARYRENQASLPLIGQGLISVQLALDNKGGMNKVYLALELPALETATGQNLNGYTAAPRVAYSHKAKSEFFLPSRGTGAQRKDLRVLNADLHTDAQVIDAIDNLNAILG